MEELPVGSPEKAAREGECPGPRPGRPRRLLFADWHRITRGSPICN